MSCRFAHAVELASVRAHGDDRARVAELVDGLVIALADGAGGTGNGAFAAQAIVDAALASADADPCALLEQLDEDAPRLRNGQSTAVLLSVSDAAITGASVGDSGAWLIDGARIIDLTEGQTRKPLVGSGCIPFRITGPALGAGTLLVASDGLLRYAQPRDIARVASGPDLAAAARALVELVRLPSGALQDDVAVVLCRVQSSDA